MLERFSLRQKVIVRGLVLRSRVVVRGKALLVLHHFSFCLETRRGFSRSGLAQVIEGGERSAGVESRLCDYRDGVTAHAPGGDSHNVSSGTPQLFADDRDIRLCGYLTG
jgi:hypothetical protein